MNLREADLTQVSLFVYNDQCTFSYGYDFLIKMLGSGSFMLKNIIEL